MQTFCGVALGNFDCMTTAGISTTRHTGNRRNEFSFIFLAMKNGVNGSVQILPLGSALGGILERIKNLALKLWHCFDLDLVRYVKGNPHSQCWHANTFQPV